MDTEYILDCAFELGELTSVEYAVLASTKGSYWTLRNAVDQNQHMPEFFLPNTARSFLDQAPAPIKSYFALSGLPGLEFGLKSFAGRVAHLVQAKSQYDLLGCSPLAAFLYPELAAIGNAKLVNREADISEGLVRMMAERMFDQHVQRWNEDLQLTRHALEWYREDNGEMFRLMRQAESLDDKGIREAPVTVRQAAQAHQRRVRQALTQQRKAVSRAKAAIKKATKLFQNLGKEQNLQMFVSGGDVTLSNPNSAFKFVLKPLGVQGWLIDRTQVGRTHTPYELSLYTKDDVYLSKLCVYFDKTPVLDQLLALTLFIESGDELKVLERANWFATENWTAEKAQVVLAQYPQLEKKLPRQIQEGDAQRGTVRDTLLNTEFFLREEWEPFKGRVEQWVSTWMEPAQQAMLGITRSAGELTQQLIELDQQARQLDREVLQLTAA